MTKDAVQPAAASEPLVAEPLIVVAEPLGDAGEQSRGCGAGTPGERRLAERGIHAPAGLQARQQRRNRAQRRTAGPHLPVVGRGGREPVAIVRNGQSERGGLVEQRSKSRGWWALVSGGLADLPERPQRPARTIGLTGASVRRTTAVEEVPRLEATIPQLHALQERERLQCFGVMTRAGQRDRDERGVSRPCVVPGAARPCRNGTARLGELVQVEQRHTTHVLPACALARHRAQGQPCGIGYRSARNHPGDVLGGSPAGTCDQIRLCLRRCRGRDQGGGQRQRAQGRGRPRETSPHSSPPSPTVSSLALATVWHDVGPANGERGEGYHPVGGNSYPFPCWPTRK